MRYWDSSALISLLVQEPRTENSEALLRSDPQIVTWWLSKVECASALCRLNRDHGLSDVEVQLALSDLETLWKSVAEIQPVPDVRVVAMRMLRVHPLKTADAMQLAAATLAAGNDRSDFYFISYDDQLVTAAGKEGFEVVTT